MDMAINKVIYGGNALIDLTGDDVTAASLYKGVKAHDKAGAQITGTNPYNAATVDPAVTSALAAIAEKGVDTTGAGLADIAGLVESIQAGGEYEIISGDYIPAETITLEKNVLSELTEHNAGKYPIAFICWVDKFTEANGFMQSIVTASQAAYRFTSTFHGAYTDYTYNSDESRSFNYTQKSFDTKVFIYNAYNGKMLLAGVPIHWMVIIPLNGEVFG